MSDWQIVFSDPEPWPLVHVFVPAIVSIYCKNIWILISIIYLFESAEFLFSQLPVSEADYWAEKTPIDSMVSDIIMGLVGFAAVKATNTFGFGQDSSISWLKPGQTSPVWYKKIVPYLHVVLAASSTRFIEILDKAENLPNARIWKFISFGISYIILALLFGHTKWAIFSTLNISLISLASLLTKYTPLYSAGIVLITSAVAMKYSNEKINDSVHSTTEKTTLGNMKLLQF